MPRYNQIFLSIIIPTYNEEKRILGSLEKIQDFMKNSRDNSRLVSIEVIIVDDGSLDRTVPIVTAFIKNKPLFRLIENSHRGKALTVKRGIAEAQGEFVLFSDADLSTPINEVNQMLKIMIEQNVDIVIATREGKTASRLHEPYSRHFFGRIFNFVIRTFILSEFQDTQCGFKLFKKKVAQELFQSLLVYGEHRPKTKMAFTGAFDTELLLIAQQRKFQIAQHPVTWTYYQTQNVKPLREIPLILIDLSLIFINKLKGKYQKPIISA